MAIMASLVNLKIPVFLWTILWRIVMKFQHRYRWSRIGSVFREILKIEFCLNEFSLTFPAWIKQGTKKFVCSFVFTVLFQTRHDDIIKWKHFPHYSPFVRGIHRSPVNCPHKGQWRGALMFSLICPWTNGSVNNGEAGDLRRHRAHYDVIEMTKTFIPSIPQSNIIDLWNMYSSLGKCELFSMEHTYDTMPSCISDTNAIREKTDFSYWNGLHVIGVSYNNLLYQTEYK